LFSTEGILLGAGHNRECNSAILPFTAKLTAFRNAGRQRSYRSLIMVTTLAPAGIAAASTAIWLSKIVVGESRNFQQGASVVTMMRLR